MKKTLIAVIALLMVCMFSIPAYADHNEGLGPPGHRPKHHFPPGRPICWHFSDNHGNEGTYKLYFVNIRLGHYLLSGVVGALGIEIPISGSAQFIGDKIRMVFTMATGEGPVFHHIGEASLNSDDLHGFGTGVTFLLASPDPNPEIWTLHINSEWTPCD